MAGACLEERETWSLDVRSSFFQDFSRIASASAEVSTSFLFRETGPRAACACARAPKLIPFRSAGSSGSSSGDVSESWSVSGSSSSPSLSFVGESAGSLPCSLSRASSLRSDSDSS